MDSGISRSTWSVWGRGERSISRERLREVMTRYDEARVGLWLQVWDQLAGAGDPFSQDPMTAPDDETASGVKLATSPPPPEESASAGSRIAGRRNRWTLVAAGIGAVGLAAGVFWASPGIGGSSAGGTTPGVTGGGMSSTWSPSSPPVDVPTTAALVTVLSPRDGSSVRSCEIFTGTARLPPGKTLILGMRNLSDGEDVLYYEDLRTAQQVGSITNWTIAQYFGSGDGSIGKEYEVRVIVVDRTVVEEQLRAAREAGRNWYSSEKPQGAYDVGILRFHRVAGPGPDSCL